MLEKLSPKKKTGIKNRKPSAITPQTAKAENKNQSGGGCQRVPNLLGVEAIKNGQCTHIELGHATPEFRVAHNRRNEGKSAGDVGDMRTKKTKTHATGGSFHQNGGVLIVKGAKPKEGRRTGGGI